MLRIKHAATEPRSEPDESGEQEPGTETEAPADGADGGSRRIKEQSGGGNKDEGKTQRDQGASQEFGQQTEAVEEGRSAGFQLMMRGARVVVGGGGGSRGALMSTGCSWMTSPPSTARG